jgi:hypothetical protein
VLRFFSKCCGWKNRNDHSALKKKRNDRTF